MMKMRGKVAIVAILVLCTMMTTCFCARMLGTNNNEDPGGADNTDPGSADNKPPGGDANNNSDAGGADNKAPVGDANNNNNDFGIADNNNDSGNADNKAPGSSDNQDSGGGDDNKAPGPGGDDNKAPGPGGDDNKDCGGDEAEPLVPCYFIFGDSLSDVGNNNNLNTKAKVNYPPYGIDFPGGKATGRFSNGRNFVDKVSQLLGFKDFIPPFSTAKDKEILKGVNYASGAAGIRAETGEHLGERICLDKQIENHKATIAKFTELGGPEATKNLGKCLYSVNMGSNDYINNYFMPDHYNSSSLFKKPEQFADALIQQYSAQIKAIYDTGARRFTIGGMSLIGCIPAELAMHNTTECVDEINKAVDLFNKRLLNLVNDFNSKYHDAKFTYIDFGTMQALTRLIVGFTTDKGCCELREDYQCVPNSKPCPFRSLYEFVDGFHPTQITNDLAAILSFFIPIPLIVQPQTIGELISENSND